MKYKPKCETNFVLISVVNHVTGHPVVAEMQSFGRKKKSLSLMDAGSVDNQV